jgi:transposase
MRKLKEILRLRLGEKRSLRDTSASVRCSPSKVHDVVLRFNTAGLTWPVDDSLEESDLERLMYDSPGKTMSQKVSPDLNYINTEMHRKGVTLQLLWQEYKEINGSFGYQYSRFCRMYREFQKKLSPGMRYIHKAGEKGFVDWSGDGVKITNGDTGTVWEAPVFVGVLGASGYTFATAKPDRTSRNWIDCHCEMYEYWGGVPELTIPDNERTGITKACNYEPDLNLTYFHMSRHYETTVIPTRPGKPKDKALVENAVLIVQRWIIAALRNHTFFNVAQANEAIREKLIDYNNKKMQLVDSSRSELFILLDKPALKPLPAIRYQYAEWSEPKVHIDYHILVDKHYYSVPYQYIGEKVSACRTSSMVEVFYKNQRIAVHKRVYYSKEPSTLKEHMPSHHKAYSEWSPDRFIRWAQKVGPNAGKVIENNLASRRHPEQAFKTCLGIMRLGKRYDDKRLESACKRALFINSVSYRSINNILEKGLDKKELPVAASSPAHTMPIHDNIRGPENYH